MSQIAATRANSFLAKIPLTYIPRFPHPINPSEIAEFACAPRMSSGLAIMMPAAAAPVLLRK
jgi:hypothetical protein